MSDAVEIWETPKASEVYMLVGWRQWADAGSISSGLPQYLIQQTGAQKIGSIRSDGFYLFQFPGTHDLVRPIVKFDEGYPESIQAKSNDIYYVGDKKRGLVIFIGDEPHMDVERYTTAFLHAAMELRVKRIVGFGGVYGELPYDKDRLVSSTYSLKHLKEEIEGLAVNLSDYHGGASIGSYICRRAGEQGMEYVAFYAFAPTYDFSNIAQLSSSIRIENDFKAWLDIMRRVNYMLRLNMDLSDLEEKSQRLIEMMDNKVEELEGVAPQLGVREYMKRLADEFVETPFEPLDDVWEDEIRRLFDKYDDIDES
jgi:proteasome assembly chaperone (PAC2) family protein